jgi:murein DD-endopeptidase MepM/ murein hydrolase activator NlpD
MPANNGVNIGLSADAEIHAVFDGEVKRVIVMPGYGRCVLVQHGTYFTFYCKLGEVGVKAGDKVKAGQALGRVDTIDGQTQLHFEVWKEKEPENPELWLRKK